MGVGLGQRHLDRLGADECCGFLAGLITGVGYHEASLWRREGQHCLVQGRAGSGEGLHIFRLQTFLPGQNLLERAGFFVHVPAAFSDHIVDGVGCLGTGAHGILIGVDLYSIRRDGSFEHRQLRHGGLGVEGQSRTGGEHRRDTAEVPT